jgi:hypothetical protein
MIDSSETATTKNGGGCEKTTERVTARAKVNTDSVKIVVAKATDIQVHPRPSRTDLQAQPINKRINLNINIVIISKSKKKET